jgi:hypothetical protein
MPSNEIFEEDVISWRVNKSEEKGGEPIHRRGNYAMTSTLPMLHFGICRNSRRPWVMAAGRCLFRIAYLTSG